MKLSQLFQYEFSYLKNDGWPEAVNHVGHSVQCNSCTATAWNLYGGLNKCYPASGSDLEFLGPYHKLILAMHPGDRSFAAPVVRYGRNHSYEEVIELIKNAGV